MTYWTITSSVGYMTFMYGMIQNYHALAIIGIIMAAVSMICARILEDRLEDKIKKFEKELKEIKSNDQRDSM